jgi:RNA polymerase sigma-70 factor, ECF subfamily
MTNGRTGPADDAALVEAMVAGSEAALEALYDRYVGGIFAAVYRMTSDRGVAEEIVQETFLTMWDRAESFDPAVGTLAAWLHAIARNRAIDRLRAAGRRPRLVELSSAAGADEDPTRAIDRLVTSGSIVSGSTPPLEPEAAFEVVGAREAIRAALQTMTDDERTVIRLAYQDELTQSEIADRLGWPLGTVKTRTRRALRQLRERLGPDYASVGDMTASIPAVDD